MKIVDNVVLQKEVAAAERVAATVRAAGKKQIAEDLLGAVEDIKRQRFVIGVVGSAKRGKSTLINGMLGRRDDKCAPIGRFPVTSVISIFGKAESLSARVTTRDGNVRSISESEIRLYVTEDQNPGNRKDVRSVEVLGPFEGLEEGICLVDTPGADNALTAVHGEILVQFLPVADAVVFLVTAEEPLTQTEKDLLVRIKKENTKKLFFAVNKVDRVESGELDPDELAAGIEHNRKVLEDVGFPDVRFYEISAKNYHEQKEDAGADQLFCDIRKLIAENKVDWLAKRLRERTEEALNKGQSEIARDLECGRLTETEIEEQHKAIQDAKRQLQRGRLERGRIFVEAWNDAFDQLEKDLRSLNKELSVAYAGVVDQTLALKVASLLPTIHADVQASFAERLNPLMNKCNDALGVALAKLSGCVKPAFPASALDIAPDPIGRSAVEGGRRIVSAVLPSLVTGTVAATLPGLAGSIIASAAPAVTAVTINPATWLPYIGTGITASLTASTAAVCSTFLTVVATPAAIAAFGLSAFRAWDAWRNNLSMQKNELKTKVLRMVDDGCGQVLSDIGKFRRAHERILADFERDLEDRVDREDARLEELARNRPRPEEVKAREDALRAIERVRQEVLSANGTAGQHIVESKNRALDDGLFQTGEKGGTHG